MTRSTKQQQFKRIKGRFGFFSPPEVLRRCRAGWRRQETRAAGANKSDFHNEPSVIPQQPTTFICPDSSQPPPFINPASRRRHAPPTPRVVYHVRWNRVSPAVNLGNGVTRGDPWDPRTNLPPQTLHRGGRKNDEGFQEVERPGVRRRRCCAH